MVYLIFTDIYHKNQPFMHVNIPVPWILWKLALKLTQKHLTNLHPKKGDDLFEINLTSARSFTHLRGMSLVPKVEESSPKNKLYGYGLRKNLTSQNSMFGSKNPCIFGIYMVQNRNFCYFDRQLGIRDPD